MGQETRKSIVGVLLAVVLAAAGLSSVACIQANKYEPMPEQKLVGMGFYGTEPFGDETVVFRPMFVFTNPDPVSKITVDGISIFAENGEVMYTGPLLRPDGKTPWTEPMKPHETRFVTAFPEGMPMLPDLTMPLNAITVEILWSSTKEDLPLTGWQQSGVLRFDAEGNLVDAGAVWETQMVNMEQKLKSTR